MRGGSGNHLSRDGGAVRRRPTLRASKTPAEVMPVRVEPTAEIAVSPAWVEVLGKEARNAANRAGELSWRDWPTESA